MRRTSSKQGERFTESGVAADDERDNTEVAAAAESFGTSITIATVTDGNRSNQIEWYNVYTEEEELV